MPWLPQACLFQDTDLRSRPNVIAWLARDGYGTLLHRMLVDLVTSPHASKVPTVSIDDSDYTESAKTVVVRIRQTVSF
jgi:hypothetical protein